MLYTKACSFFPQFFLLSPPSSVIAFLFGIIHFVLHWAISSILEKGLSSPTCPSHCCLIFSPTLQTKPSDTFVLAVCFLFSVKLPSMKPSPSFAPQNLLSSGSPVAPSWVSVPRAFSPCPWDGNYTWYTDSCSALRPPSQLSSSSSAHSISVSFANSVSCSTDSALPQCLVLT